MLGLGLGAVRVIWAVADVHVWGAALSAGRVLAQVQVDQVQSAQLANPQAFSGVLGSVAGRCSIYMIGRVARRFSGGVVLVAGSCL